MLEGYGSPDSRIYEEIRINLRHRLRHVTLTFFTKPLKCLSYKRGGMAERLNALVLKTSKGSNLSRVRIPVPPPHSAIFFGSFLGLVIS